MTTRILIGIILFLRPINFVAQDFSSREMIDSAEVFTMKRLIKPEVKWLFKGWRYSPNDSSSFAEPKYNDAHWIETRSSLNAFELKHTGFKGFGRFRYRLKLDSGALPLQHVLYMSQQGATELYINGKLYNSIGRVSADADNELRYSNELEPVFLPFSETGDYHIAVRFSNHNYESSYNYSGMLRAGFDVFLTEPIFYFKDKLNAYANSIKIGLGFFIFFATVSLLHFLLFIFYRERKSNLYFSLFTIVLSYFFLCYYLTQTFVFSVDLNHFLLFGAVLLIPVFLLLLQYALYSFFYDSFPKFFKVVLIYAIVNIFSFFVSNIAGFVLTLIFLLYVTVDSVKVLVRINREKKKGAVIITSGYSIFILFFVLSFLQMLFTGNVNIGGKSITDNVLLIVFITGIISIPLSMSVFLAWDFAYTNRVLKTKITEVEQLSEKTVEQEKEKQKILANQNEKLESQVLERTSEIEEKKKIIEEKNKDITDSINYAQRIQKSILPTDTEIKSIFPESFVLFKPRDIVSGDFYLFKKKENCRFAIMADCTGHGVPGALMSMIGSNLLYQIIMERNIWKPHLILAELHREVKRTLRQSEGVSSHDGMDISIAVLNDQMLYLASANRPVYLIHEKELKEIKPTKQSIGGSSTADDLSFELVEFPIVSNQMLYMFSDGYADQFGGEAGKKFKIKNLSNCLMTLYEKPISEQSRILYETFDNWKGSLEQVDDVTLIGIRI